MNILILGKAKTGTTIISKTIQQSLPNTAYHFEPKEPSFFICKKWNSNKNHLAKFIYDEWQARPLLRESLVHNELIEFKKLIYTMRDPRDEIISRLMYFILYWASRNRGEERKIEAWLRILREKEANPRSISLIEIIEKKNRLFGGNLLAEFTELTKTYLKFVSGQPSHGFLVKYEDFVNKENKSLEGYLGFKLNTEVSLGNLESKKRSASYGNWKSFILDSDIAPLNDCLGDTMERHGYLDWDIETPTKLDSAIYSGYVEKLLKKTKPTWVKNLHLSKVYASGKKAMKK